MGIGFIGCNYLKRHIVLLIACCVFMSYSDMSIAQSSVTFDAGQNFSTFKYSDSQGEIKDFAPNITGCYSLGYNYVTPGGLLIRSSVGMRKGGASLDYNKRNVEWNLHYADINIGAGYIFSKYRVKPYVAATPFFAYMIKGEQTIGQTKYDIKKDKTLSAMDYGVCVIPGLKVELSNTISFYTEYRQIIGLQNLETNAGNGQKTYNRAFSFNLGVSVAIIRYNYVTTQ